MIEDPTLREALFNIQDLHLAVRYLEACQDFNVHEATLDEAEQEFITSRNRVEESLRLLLANMGVRAEVYLERVHPHGLE